MKCPSCNHNFEWKEFLNLSLSKVCPDCKRRITFNPSMIIVLVIFFASYIIWGYIPSFNIFIVDLIFCLVLAFAIVVAGLAFALYKGFGKFTASNYIVEDKPKDK